MKKLVVDVTDVEVKLIRFFDSDPYAGFADIPGRQLTEVHSELDEIDAIMREKPIAFVKQKNGSYLLITKKPGS